MFREDVDGLRRILVASTAVVIVLIGLFWMFANINHNNQTTNQVRIESCQSISNESLRDDCINGGYYATDSNSNISGDGGHHHGGY